MKKLCCILLISGLITACTKTERIIDRMPPEKADESFSTATTGTSGLAIKKDSLEKAFLLLSSSKTLSKSPQWKFHPARMVSFERHSNQIGLYELSRGNVYQNISASRLIQTFPILKESEAEITIDTSKGINSVEIAETLGSFLDDDKYSPLRTSGGRETALVTELLVTRQNLENNRLIIQQDAKIRTSILEKADRSQETFYKDKTPRLRHFDYNLQTRFEIIPYKENKKFNILPMDAEFRTGYFTTDIHISGQGEAVKATTRWDISEEKPPIRYILSKDIPEKYLADIEAGLNYWNIVFGKKVLTIERSSKSDPDFEDRAVIVHWTDWKDAGFAYAGFQSDPLSGEILRGQIFLPSSWTEGSPNMAMDSYVPHHIKCLHKVHRMTDSTTNEELYRKYGLIHTVAHEAGHVFGLRHNFAASSAVKSSTIQLQEMRETIQSGTLPTELLETSTSVMDYISGADVVITGKLTETHAHSYDKDTIEWGYLGKKEPQGQSDEFCTDEHLMEADFLATQILNCQTHDVGGNIFLNAMASIQKKRLSTLKLLLQSQIAKLYPSSGNRSKLDLSQMDYHGPQRDHELDRLLFKRAGDSDSSNQLHSIQHFNVYFADRIAGYRSETHTDHDSYLNNSLKKVFERAAAQIDLVTALDLRDEQGNLFIDRARRDLYRLLDSPEIKSGLTSENVPYTLTEQDVSDLLASFEPHLKKFGSNRALEHLLNLLPEKMRMDWDPVSKISAEVRFYYRDSVPQGLFASEAIKGLIDFLKLKDGRKPVGKINGLEFSAPASTFDRRTENAIVDAIVENRQYLTNGLGIDVKSEIKKTAAEPLLEVLRELKIQSTSHEFVRNELSRTLDERKIDLNLFNWAQAEMEYIEKLNLLPDSI